MTVKDAQQIAHGLIQGCIAPTIGSWTCRAFTAHWCRRFKPLTSKAGRIEPKRKLCQQSTRGRRNYRVTPGCGGLTLGAVVYPPSARSYKSVLVSH